ncbi:MAG: hypothetical protein NTX64_00150 [Elusimicrobia bacterium]|nr:hypothetical protein [Elusimicrobiota bacterium]
MRLRSLVQRLGHHVTVLVIPHTDLPLWRVRFSFHFLLFIAALWTGATVIAGFAIGSHADYMITKADNYVMRAKMLYLANEVERARSALEMARASCSGCASARRSSREKTPPEAPRRPAA